MWCKLYSDDKYDIVLASVSSLYKSFNQMSTVSCAYKATKN